MVCMPPLPSPIRTRTFLCAAYLYVQGARRAAWAWRFQWEAVVAACVKVG